MRIVVCVKQVPDTTEVKIDPLKNVFVREGVPSILNPFDEFAIEEALRIREQHGGHVIVLSMGPPQAEEVLDRCLRMGADEGILLTDLAFIGSDTLVTSFALSKVIARIEYDIVLCGQEAIDGATGQVGPGLAEHLGIPQITYVKKLMIDPSKKKVIAHHETEEGYQVIECKLPVLITVIKGINTPRKPAATAMAKVKRLSASDLGCDINLLGVEGSPTQVVKIFPSKLRPRKHVTISGSLPAHERIKMIMSGGLKEKDKSLQLEGDIDQISSKVVEFLSTDGLFSSCS